MSEDAARPPNWRVLLVGAVKVHQQSLALAIRRFGVGVVETAALADMVARCEASTTPIVLVDASWISAAAFAHHAGNLPANVVVLAYAVEPDAVEEIQAFAALGVSGFIECDAGLTDMELMLREARDGRAPCSPSIAALLRESGVTPRGAQRLPGLTVREHAVASLAAIGLQDKEVAARLGLSISTVKAHLHAVYRKLGIRGRWELRDRLGAGTSGRHSASGDRP